MHLFRGSTLRIINGKLNGSMAMSVGPPMLRKKLFVARDELPGETYPGPINQLTRTPAEFIGRCSLELSHG
ncbi:MAG: hypothetical protein CMF59_03820 [Leptospiraceae bacterium]|nr:hypothetical protein [Leptospiraceae bacterium]